MRKTTLLFSLLLCTMTAMAQITAVTDIVNGKCYTIKSQERGPIFVTESGSDIDNAKTNASSNAKSNIEEYIISTAYDGGVEASEPGTTDDYKFALLRAETTESGYYYLYSVKKNQFAILDNTNLKLSDTPNKNCKFQITTSGTYFRLSTPAGAEINVTGWDGNYGVRMADATVDGGNKFVITEAGDFDSSEALTKITELEFVPPVVMEEGALYKLYNVDSGKYMKIAKTNSTGTNNGALVVSDFVEDDQNMMFYFEHADAENEYRIKSASGYYVNPVQWDFNTTTEHNGNSYTITLDNETENIYTIYQDDTSNTGYIGLGNNATSSTLYADTGESASGTEWQFIKVIEDGKAYRIAGKMSDGTLRYLYRSGINISWSTEKNTTNSGIFIAQKSGNYYTLVGADADCGWTQGAGMNTTHVQIDIVGGKVGTSTLTLVGKVSGDKPNRTYSCESNGMGFYSRASTEIYKNVTETTTTTDFVFEEVTDYAGFATTIAQGSNGNYGTLHLPFAVTLPEGVTAHSVELSADGTHLKTTALELAGNILPANTPVLLKGEEGGIKNFVPAASSGLSALSTGFTGTLGATAVTANSYILAFEGEAGSEIKFFALDGTDNTVNANKAYYVLPATAQATRALHIDMAGTTGIDEVESESAQEVIYDLAGRRVEAMTAPGIYIVNGNKVLVK